MKPTMKLKPTMKFVLTYNMFIRAHVFEKTAGGKVEDHTSPCLLYKNLFEGAPREDNSSPTACSRIFDVMSVYIMSIYNVCRVIRLCYVPLWTLPP